MRFINYILNGFKHVDPDAPTAYNYQYYGLGKPESYPPVDATMHHAVRAPVLHAFEKILLPIDRESILNDYKRPIISNDAVIKSFFRGDLPRHTVPKDASYYRALDLTTKYFAPDVPIRPVHYCDLRYYPWNLRPSAELPFVEDKQLFRKVQLAAEAGDLPDKKMSFGNLYNYIFEYNRPIIHHIKNGPFNCEPGTSWPNDDYLVPMRSHARAMIQSADRPDKIRFVYGYSKLGIFTEAMFFWPLFIFYHLKRKSPLLWGYETLTGGWYKLQNRLDSNPFVKGSILELDWSGFDFHALFDVFDDIRIQARTYFVFNKGYQRTKDYFGSESDPHRLQNLWDWMWYSIMFTPIRLPDGKLYQRLWRGVPSGLFITQWLDSFYNCIMILTILDSMGFEITKDVILMILGDDSITRLRLSIPFDQHEAFLRRFQHLANHYFSAEFSAEKSQLHNTLNGVKCLGYRNVNGLPVRDKSSLLAVLLNPKARRPTFEQLKARCVGIAYASVGMDSTVMEICRDVYDYLDRQGIKADPSGLADMFDPNLGIHIDVTFFPDVLTIQKGLLHLSDPKVQTHRSWPTDHFVDPCPGSVE